MGMFSNRSIRDGLCSFQKSSQILDRWFIQQENAQVFHFELTEAEMEELDGLTTTEALCMFEALYKKCGHNKGWDN